MPTRGPIESSLSTPGFRMFWDRLLSSLESYRAELIAASEDAIRVADTPKATTLLTRATSVTDTLARISNAPKHAIDRERNVTSPPTPGAGVGLDVP